MQLPRPFLLMSLLLVLFSLCSVLPFEHVLENDLAKDCWPVDRPMDMLFLLDGSGSVGGSTFQTQMQLLNELVDLLDIGNGRNQSQLAVMQYATYSFIEFPFNAYRDKIQLRQALQRIRHKSGTTKTGKALEKAYQLFRDPSSGSRQGNVVQVVVAVTDGHSQDDPVPAAVRLRQSGVHLIALGIGSHINVGELLQITGDRELALENMTLAESLEKFTDIFRRLAKSEHCEYTRGGRGADIRCDSDSVQIWASTKTSFRGLFYALDHWAVPDCMMRGGANIKAEENGTELVLRIPLGKCGMDWQFSTNPRGQFFRLSVVLQFHPNYRTAADKVFPVLCFYRDRSQDTAVGEPSSDIDWQLVREHTQRRENSRRHRDELPCQYRLLADQMGDMLMGPGRAGGGGQHKDRADCGGPLELSLGQSIIHSWECNGDNFDVYQSILVHSCVLLDPANGSQLDGHLLIDENGCSLEPNLLETPQYVNQMKAFARGIAIRGIGSDGPVKMRCLLRFCDRLMGECEEILPPKCSDKNISERMKRQVGVPFSIKPLGGGPVLPLVMFDRTKTSAKRRRLHPTVDQRVRLNSVENPVDVDETAKSNASTNKKTTNMIKTTSKKAVEVHEEMEKEHHKEEYQSEEIIGKESDPFQDEMDLKGSMKSDEEITIDQKVLDSFGETEIVVQTQEVTVREQILAQSWCRRKANS